MLGEGAFSRVYEAIWNGKHIVVKVTRSKNDATSYQKMQAIAEQYGQTHIIKLHDIIEIEDQRITNSRFKVKARSNKIYIILTEYLVPLPSAFNEKFLGGFSPDLEQAYKHEKKASYISEKEIFNIIFEILEPYYVRKSKTVDSNNVKIVSKEMYEILIDPEIDLITGLNRIEDYIFEESEFFQKVKKDIGMVSLNSINNEIYDRYKKNLEYNTHTFPHSSKLYHLIYKDNKKDSDNIKKRRVRDDYKFPDPRVESLFNFINELYESGIAKWEDLHAENVMMRPGTNDIVISDPGLFRF